MGYIYKITNIVNNKVYIGQTIRTIEERWRDHQNLRYTEKNNTRPLYLAFEKYGIENFTIEKIEEVENNLLNEREEYWINFFDSYNNGYNATYGGNGSKSYNYELIFHLWQEGETSKSISIKLNCSEQTVKRALDSFNVDKEERKQRGKLNCSKKVLMIDKESGEILNTFSSFNEAARFLGKTGGAAISRACNYANRSAYGYKWKLADNPKEIKLKKKGITHKVAMIDCNTNEIIDIFESCADAARKTGCRSTGINKVCNNKLQTHNGYKWKYLD